MPSGSGVVLYYHAIPAETRSRFAAQMDMLLRYAQPVPAGYDGALAPGRRYAAVTFDDGFVSVLENALPELEARNIPATLFVPTASLGHRPAWVKTGSPAARETILSPEQLKVLRGNGTMAIGAHTVNHINLLKLDAAKARAELAGCKTTLESLLGAEVPLFSFPHGAHNDRLLEEARRLGYRRVFTISPTLAFTTPSEFVTGRTLADPTDWPIEFVLKAVGAYRWMAGVSNLKACLFRRKGAADRLSATASSIAGADAQSSKC